MQSYLEDRKCNEFTFDVIGTLNYLTVSSAPAPLQPTVDFGPFMLLIFLIEIYVDV